AWRWQICWRARGAPARQSPDQLRCEDARRKAGEVTDRLALADELDRDAGLLLHRKHETALSRTVEFGEHEPRDAGVLDEGLRLSDPVLSGGGVEHQEHLGDRRE